MIKPHGSETLNPRFVYDTERHAHLAREAESLPSLLLNSAAAAGSIRVSPASPAAQPSSSGAMGSGCPCGDCGPLLLVHEPISSIQCQSPA